MEPIKHYRAYEEEDDENGLCHGFKPLSWSVWVIGSTSQVLKSASQADWLSLYFSTASRYSGYYGKTSTYTYIHTCTHT